jgi:hypothetical protein
MLKLEGMTLGRWFVEGECKKRDKNGRIRWKCKCTCGTQKDVIGSNLIKGLTTSCGCLKREKAGTHSLTHGLSGHPLYQKYRNMKGRCSSTNKQKKNYYDKGIEVCEEWLQSPVRFIKEMEHTYREGLQLDRIDNDKGYSKENCRWVTHSQNNYNSGAKTSGSSKYKGVYYCKDRDRWKCSVSREGEVFNLGSFVYEKEAAKVYNKKAKELFGEYAYINKVED